MLYRAGNCNVDRTEPDYHAGAAERWEEQLMQGVAVLARAKTSGAGYAGAFQNVSGPLRPYMPPQSGGNGAVMRFAPLDDTLVG